MKCAIEIGILLLLLLLLIVTLGLSLGSFTMHLLLEMIEKELIQHMSSTLLGTSYCFEILMDFDSKMIENRTLSGEFESYT